MLFTLIATANAAGYRYGVSDQAFYIPAVLRALNPSAFPHDAPLIDAQGRLMLLDRVIAAVLRSTAVPLDTLFFAGYLLSIAIIWAALVLIGSRIYHSAWGIAALAAIFSLRHRIAQTSANSFEPYFHPRMLAFGLGALAVAAVLRRRAWVAVALVAAAAVVHVTTALWFAVLVGVALARLDRTMRWLAVAGTITAAAVGAWALTAGPLRGSMQTMDAVWLQPLASKDSVFPQAWPAWAWAANLGTFAALVLLHWHRRRRREATAEDEALVWGAAALVLLFLVTLPAVGARLAFPVQLQISRVFWLVDFLATVYLVAVLMPWRRAVAAIVVAIAVSRAVYIIGVEHAERGLFALHLQHSAWQDAMDWVARQPPGVAVIADPGHAWKYGTSVRVAAARDVYLEDVKDSAIAMYSRDVAVRVVDRAQALGDFAALTPDKAAALASRYDLDYLVTEHPLAMTVAYRNDRFTIYALRPDGKLK